MIDVPVETGLKKWGRIKSQMREINYIRSTAYPMGRKPGFCMYFYGVITPDLRGVCVQGFRSPTLQHSSRYRTLELT